MTWWEKKADAGETGDGNQTIRTGKWNSKIRDTGKGTQKQITEETAQNGKIHKN